MKNKTAEEMFEELGYRKETLDLQFCNEIYEISYKKEDVKTSKEILFLIEIKEIFIEELDETDGVGSSINVDELIAIKQQMKELGWLND